MRRPRRLSLLLLRARARGATHTAPSKYHDEIISLVFIHTKYGEPIVIMDFRRAIQKVLCLSPPLHLHNLRVPADAEARVERGVAPEVELDVLHAHVEQWVRLDGVGDLRAARTVSPTLGGGKLHRDVPYI